MRVPYQDVHAALLRVLLDRGFERDRAELCARLFAEASRDGVYSHGLNRFPCFVSMIREGRVDVQAKPECMGQAGAVEQWEGHLGPGNVNAHQSMGRAIQLARVHGMGGVALRNTNHWMRGGSYGWQAAEAGVVGVCWSNTMPNLPPWGARERRLGNNPLVIAVPRPGGHVVLDMALSQFSYGTLETYRRRGDLLPVDGGFDQAGRLTRDPGAIEASQRPLPIGFWKGAGLALVLDMLAALLSDGQATCQIAKQDDEYAVSQVFVAFDLARLHEKEHAARLADDIVAHVKRAAPAAPGGEVYYPGERTLATRRENMEKGVPVEPAIWRQVKGM